MSSSVEQQRPLGGALVRDQVFAALRDAVLVTDAAGRVVDCNAMAEELFALRRGEILGSSPAQLYGHGATPDFQVLDALRTTGSWQGDFVVEARAGRPPGIVHVRVTALRDEQGRMVGAAGVIRDVTAERRTAEHLALAESQVRAVLDLAPIGIASSDIAGDIVAANPAFASIVGHPVEQLIGRPLADLSHPDDPPLAEDLGEALRAGTIDRLDFERRYVRPDGETLWLRVLIAVVRDGTGAPEQFIVALEDITQRRLENDRLTAIGAAQLAIATVDLSPTKVMHEVCRHAQELTGADGAGIQLLEEGEIVVRAATGSSAHAVGMRMATTGITGLAMREDEAQLVLDAETDPRVLSATARAAAARSLVTTPLRRGSEVVGVITVTAAEPHRFTEDDRQTLKLLAAPFGNALANAWRLEETAVRATTDSLTGLANRPTALRALERSLHRQARHGGRTVVIFIDLDGFKQVNDTLGHWAGDRVLIEVGHRLRGVVRKSDVPARFGGDEFVVVCDDVADDGSAEVLAGRLLETLPGGYETADGKERSEIGASIGVAVATSWATPEEMLAAADEAMYAAKQAGGNRYVLRPLG